MSSPSRKTRSSRCHLLAQALADRVDVGRLALAGRRLRGSGAARGAARRSRAPPHDRRLGLARPRGIRRRAGASSARRAAGSSRRPRPPGRLPRRSTWSIAASSSAVAAPDSTSALVALDRVLPAPLLEHLLRHVAPGRRARRGPSCGTSSPRPASGRRRRAPGRPPAAPRRRRRARRCRRRSRPECRRPRPCRRRASARRLLRRASSRPSRCSRR